MRHLSLTELNEDFCGGLTLIALVEVLSEKKMSKYNRRPRIHAQKVENIQMALNFLKSEGVKLVNIGKFNT